MAGDFREMARALLKKEADPALLDLCAQEAEAYICNYCGVEALPEGCEAVAARMLAALLEGDCSGIKALSRGDYSVSYALGGEGEGLHSFDRRLNAFRKVKW